MKNKILSKVTFLTFLLPSILAAQPNSWSVRSNFGGSARESAVGFSIGTKGYIGTGRLALGTFTKDFWSWDQSNNVWTQLADVGGVSGPLRTDAVGFSIGNKGYIGTGNSSTGNYLNDFWEFDPTNNSWIQKTNFPGGIRTYAVGFAIGNKGYIGTGASNWNTNNNDFYEYDPNFDSWVQKASFPGAGNGRSGAIGFSINSLGYLGTGYSCATSACNTPNIDFWSYDPITDSWTQRQSFAGGPRSYAFGFSIGDYGYVGGGYDITNYSFHQDFWEYNPQNDTWLNRTPYQNLAGNAVGFSICDKGYVGTGKNGTTNFNNFVQYTPQHPPVSYISTNPNSICEGLCLNFTDSSTNNPTSWLWNFPGGSPTASTNQNPTNVCFDSAGTYTISLTTSNGNCSSVANQVLTVNPNPSIPTIIENADTLVCSVSGAHYMWYKDGLLFIDTTENKLIINSSQNGIWQVIVFNSSGCSSASLDYSSTVNIQNILTDKVLLVHPNPSQGPINIQVSTIANCNLTISNLFGEILFISDINSGNNTRQISADLSAMRNGVYLIQLKIENGIMLQKLLILHK